MEASLRTSKEAAIVFCAADLDITTGEFVEFLQNKEGKEERPACAGAKFGHGYPLVLLTCASKPGEHNRTLQRLQVHETLPTPARTYTFGNSRTQCLFGGESSRGSDDSLAVSDAESCRGHRPGGRRRRSRNAPRTWRSRSSLFLVDLYHTRSDSPDRKSSSCAFRRSSCCCSLSSMSSFGASRDRKFRVRMTLSLNVWMLDTLTLPS